MSSRGLRARLVLACVAILGVLGGTYWLIGQQHAKEGVMPPLVPGHLAPHDARDIGWFFLRNRLVAAEDDPHAVAVLLDALRTPVPKAQSGRTSIRLTISDADSPFAMGLSNGRVLLVDEHALWLRRETLRDLGSALTRHRPTGIAFEPGSLTIATSRQHRLPAEGFRLSEVWDPATRSWVASGALSDDAIEEVRAALSQARTIYVGDGVPAEPIGGDRNTPWPGTRVVFQAPTQITIVPTTSWPSVMALRQSESRRGARRMDAGGTIASYAALVEPEHRSCDQAIVIPSPAYPDTASVWIRCAHSERWLYAGIVPLKYP